MGGTISQEELESWMAGQEHKARQALEQRILQLEKLNATLAAEIDRQRPVVGAAQGWYNGARNWSIALAEAVMIYEASKPK